MCKSSRNRRRAPTRRARPQVEGLEPRLVPAFVMNPNTVVYGDIDGDAVTIHSSKPIFTSTNVNTVLTFSGTGGNGQLEEIDLTKLANPSAASGDVLTLTVVRGAPQGDGFANVGYINATGIDLGGVSIKGDLGRIDAGNSNPATPALGFLIVQSMGRYGTTTQSDLASPNLDSNLVGRLGSLTVKGDLDGVTLHVTGGTNGVNGRIGTASIGGSLLATTGAADSGLIHTSGAIGTVTIQGDIVGGDQADSGEILSDTTIGRVNVFGSVLGGSGQNSGRIAAQGNVGVVQITGDLEGGAGQESGSVRSIGGSVGMVFVTGSVIGGSGTGTDVSGNSTLFVGAGSIAAQTNIGRVLISGDLQGGTGAGSGSIVSVTGKVEFLVPGTTVFLGPSIGGSLVGGSATGAGLIYGHGDVGTVRVGRDIRGGSAVDTGEVESAAGNVLGVTVGGSLVGGSTDNSGEIDSGGNIGRVTIAGDVRGGGGLFAGAVYSGAALGTVTIGGSLVGGTATNTGLVISTANLGVVRVGGDVRGGNGQNSGLISQGVPGSTATTGLLNTVSVGGSLVGGTAANTGEIEAAGGVLRISVGRDVTGGTGSSSGLIVANGTLSSVTIGGSLVGGSTSGSGIVTVDQSGYIQGDRIISLTVGGSVVAGSNNAAVGSTLTRSGSIRAAHDIGSIVVRGSLVGNSTNQVVISATGQPFLRATQRIDTAIGSLTVNGRVELTNILAGYDPTTNGQANARTSITGAVNGRASIGSVMVGGDWVQSNLVAGVAADAIGRFGPGDQEIGGTDDTSEDLIAHIASVVIGGQVVGTPGGSGTNSYAFIAEEIDSFVLGGTAFPLHAGPSNDSFGIGPTGDVHLVEVS